MADPQATNQEATIVNQGINQLVEWLSSWGIKMLAGAAPFLNWPPISWILKWAVDYKMNQVSVRAKQESTAAVIDFQKHQKVQTATTARDRLKEAIASKDPERIKKANEEFNEAYGNLGAYGGHADVNKRD